MSDNTKIEWTDATVNAVNGCSVISPGCKHCYAMKQAHRFPVRQGLTQKTAGGMVWTGEVRLSETALLQPLRWKRPRKIFWNAHGDLFHENVPDEWINRVLAVTILTPQHEHQILTKRSSRMRDHMSRFEDRPDEFGRALADVVRAAGLPKQTGLDAIDGMSFPLPNVWLGVSVENQQRADERIPDLLATPAAVRFLSCEPLLGPVDLTRIHEEFDGGLGHSWESCLNGRRFDPWGDDETGGHPKVDWVIVGGESGPGARPMHPDWARGLRDQCAAAGVPFFFKQWGDWAPATDGEIPERFGPACDPFLTICSNGFVGELSIGSAFIHKPARYPACFPNGADGDAICNSAVVRRVGKKAAGRLLDGVQHDEMPR